MTPAATRKARSFPSTVACNAAAPSAALTLKEIQDRFQEAILSGDARILDTLMDTSRTTRTTLFGVYKNAYVGRLVEVLQNEYPELHSYCGDDQFRVLAETYIAACPSQTQNARWFGTRLPEFLAGYELNADHPELAEIASIEKAIADAFDAADASVIGLAEMAQFPPESWGKLVFTAHPSAARLDLATTAFPIWKALKNDDQPPPAEALSEPVHLIVWREGTTPKVRIMGSEETMMWTEATRGVAFEGLCEMVATYDDPDTAAARAAGYLHGWLASGLLSAAAVEAKRPARRITRSGTETAS